MVRSKVLTRLDKLRKQLVNQQKKLVTYSAEMHSDDYKVGKRTSGKLASGERCSHYGFGGPTKVGTFTEPMGKARFKEWVDQQGSLEIIEENQLEGANADEADDVEMAPQT
jgi:hypothetical protein